MIIKTYAPLSGQIITDGSLNQFPLKLKNSVNIANIHNFYLIRESDKLVHDMTLDVVRRDLVKYFKESIATKVDVHEIRRNIETGQN